MDKRHRAKMTELTGGRIRFDCPMAPYTTMGVGGHAEGLVRTGGLEELLEILTYARAEGIPCLPVGRGSNLLVSDEGIEGLVILVGDASLSREQGESGGASLRAGAGLGLADLVAACRRWGLAGLEFLAGIPGSVGGAVAMNAGAFGSEIGERVLEVQWVNPDDGEWEVRQRDGLRFSYRHLHMEPDRVIIRVRLRVEADTEPGVGARIADFLKRRKRSQPVGLSSAGSVFRNPPGDYAGRLIESAGLKGRRIGGAMISPIHANYIVNTGGARARDVLQLMDLARSTVKRQTGIELEPEIRVVGR